MWTILKFKKNNFNFLTQELSKKFGANIKIYSPKILIEKYNNNKIQRKELNLLGDYLFCYHEDFDKKSFLTKLKFVKGLKYFLEGFESSQIEISKFIDKCKNLENKDGKITQNLFQEKLNKHYRFASGPFTNTIFKIIDLQKNKIDIFIGNLKTKINKKDFLYYPV